MLWSRLDGMKKVPALSEVPLKEPLSTDSDFLYFVTAVMSVLVYMLSPFLFIIIKGFKRAFTIGKQYPTRVRYQ